MTRARSCALGAAMLVATSACSDGVGPGDAPAPARLAVDARAVSASLGDTVRLGAVVLDARDRLVRDAVVSWSSLAPAVASVTSAGTLVARDTGIVRVVASVGSLVDTVRVTITRRVASIELVAADTVLVGSSIFARAIARDHRGVVIPDAPILWSTPDTAIASVRDTGIVTAYAEGDVMLRASAGIVTVTRLVRSRYRELRLGFTPATLGVGQGVACALDAGGRAHCWAPSAAIALGRGPGATNGRIGPVAGDQRFTQLELDNGTACGITADARLFCWGAHSVPRFASVPTEVFTAMPTQRVTVGSEGALCALAADGVARCWGFNDRYQVGGTTSEQVPTPTPLNTTARFIDVAMGFHEACALDAAGAPWCWGDFMAPFDPSAATPQRIAGAPPLLRVALAGGGAACGITAADAGGETWCWGYGMPGRSGFGAPARVPALPPLRSIGGADAGVCGLTANGEAWCWTFATDATADSRPFGLVPRRWGAPHRFRQVEPGGWSTGICGITSDDRVLCTGAVPSP